jgi:hypothetical protein
MSCETIIARVAAQIPGSTTNNLGFGWRVLVYGVGYVTLHQNLRFATDSGARSVDLFDDLMRPLPEDEIVARIVSMMVEMKKGKEVALPTVSPVESSPPPPKPKLVRSRAGLIGTKELRELNQMARVFDKFKQ